MRKCSLEFNPSNFCSKLENFSQESGDFLKKPEKEANISSAFVNQNPSDFDHLIDEEDAIIQVIS